MAVIYETENFLVEAPGQPLVTRTDGGHVTITPRVAVADRTQLTPSLAIELMYLTALIGEAMTIALNNRGIDIGRINYQDNGNWSVFKPEGPHLHYHLYGRARSAKIKKYGEACFFPFRETGFYDSFEPLDAADIAEMQLQITALLKTNKYDLTQWTLK